MHLRRLETNFHKNTDTFQIDLAEELTPQNHLQNPNRRHE